jgi:phage replication O-like protein O
MASPQKEKGFTPIAHDLFEAFYRCKLLEYERCVVMCIWRKTYGWSKKEDWVSHSQIMEETGISLPNIARTLKSLIKKQILSKDGKKVKVNKDYEEWKVEWRRLSHQTTQVVSPDNKRLSHQSTTKERKENTTKETCEEGVDKDISSTAEGVTVVDMANHNPLGAEVLYELSKIDPKNKNYYNNKTQREACDFLIEEYGLEEVKNRVGLLEHTNGLPYFPTITTAVQLRDKWVQLEKAVQRKKIEIKKTEVIY